MNKVYFCLFISAVAVQVPSFGMLTSHENEKMPGMLTAYNKMDGWYKDKIQQQDPIYERKFRPETKEALRIVSEENRKRKMPTLSSDIISHKILPHLDDSSARNMRATCKDINKELLDTRKMMAAEIKTAEVEMGNAFCYLHPDPKDFEQHPFGKERDDLNKLFDDTNIWQTGHALRYALVSDDIESLKRVFDIKKEKNHEERQLKRVFIIKRGEKQLESDKYNHNKTKSEDYTFYKNSLEQAIKRKSYKCIEWMIKEDPLEVKNYLAHDIVDCYQDTKELSAVGGPIVSDLWSLFPKNHHGIVNFIVNFAEYSRLEEFCKKHGCKTKDEIVDEYEKRKANSVVSLLQVPDLVRAIQKQTYSVTTRPFRSGWYKCTGDEYPVLNMRLICKDMNNAVIVPPLKDAEPYLNGETLLGQGVGKYCIRALELAIARDETYFLCELLDKNMNFCNFYKNKNRQYELYIGLVQYAIEKDSSKSFESLIKKFGYLNNFRLSGPYGYSESFGTILDDIEKRPYISKEKKEKYISLCKENGCKKFIEIIEQKQMDKKQQEDLDQLMASKGCTIF